MYSIKKYPLWESALFEDEIDVLVSVLRDALSEFSGNGAFILTGQNNQSVRHQKILSFKIGSDKEAAEEEIKNLEKAIEETMETARGDNCIKWVNNQPVMVLNASYGRFLCGFFCSDPDFSVGILAATAKTLTRLSSGDGALKGSCKEIPWHECADELPIIFKRVTELFDIYNTAAIKRWKERCRVTPCQELFFS